MKLKLLSLAILSMTSWFTPVLLQAQNNNQANQAAQQNANQSQANICASCYAGTHGLVVHSPSQAAPHALAPSRNRVGNGSGSLGQSYINQNSCGLNYVSFSQLTETRTQVYNFNSNGSGFPCNLNFVVPCGGIANSIVAYAYWSASYTEATPPAASIEITNPAHIASTYTSTIIGTGGSTCWPTNGTADYRAVVTPAINGNGSYSMTLSGFQNVGYEVDGITVIIIYKDPTGTYSGSMSIWDGCVVLIGGSYTFTSPAGNFTTCAAAPGANAFEMAADIQSNVNNNQNSNTFNGNNQVFANDFWNYNEINTNLTSGQNSCVYQDYIGNAGDCWALVAHGLYWQNTTCISCTLPNPLTVNVTSVNPTCNSSNGSATANVMGGVTPYTYSWSNGQTTSTATGLSGGTYTITIETPCDTTQQTVILIGNTLAYTNHQQNVLCNGGATGFAAVHVTGGTSPYTYSWTPVSNTTDSIGGLTAGQYILTVHDHGGCDLSDTFNITQPPLLTASTSVINENCYEGDNGSATVNAAGGTPNYQYLWSNQSMASTATGLTAGVYNVQVTDANNCPAFASATITQPTLLTLTLTGPATICTGVSGVLYANASGGTSAYNYSWNTGKGSFTSADTVSPTANTNYTCVVTDANGCTASSSIFVALGPPLIGSITGPPSVCSGNPITICGHASGGLGADSYSWQPGGFQTSCITVNPTISTTYTLYLTDVCGEEDTITRFVLANPLPNVEFASNQNAGCSPLCIQFKDLSSLATGKEAAWVWLFGNGDSSNSENPLYCYSKPGNFTVKLTIVSDSSCSASLNISDMINVYSHPEAKFAVSPQPTTILQPQIQFTDESTDQYGLVYWFWNFGNGTGNDATSNEQNPTHTYTDTGTFCASEVVVNAHGCTDTTTNCLAIDAEFSLYIPSAFSPNGSGKNPVFEAKGEYVKNFQMYIFDRWGMQLFHSTDINDGWNGNINNAGQMCQQDTYVYQIYATDSRNKQHSYVGEVTLLR